MDSNYSAPVQRQQQEKQTPPLQDLARGYLRFVSNLASATIGVAATALLGFAPLRDSAPLLQVARAHQSQALLLAGLLVILLAVAITLARRGTRTASAGRSPLVHFLVSAALSALGSALLGVLLGVGDLPSAIPLLDLIKRQPPLGVGLSASFLGLMIVSPLLGPSGDTSGGRGGHPRARNQLLLSTGVATLSCVLFISLLSAVVIRPAWCPAQICPSPEARTDPAGTHDRFLELVPTGVQSAIFSIPDDPSRYSVAQANLPTSVGAVRIDTGSPPYRAVIHVHNLQPVGGATIVFEHISVVLDSVSAPTLPLNVWVAGTDVEQHRNLLQAVYHGESPGARLDAIPLDTPGKVIELKPGETDEITIELDSKRVTALQFHIEVSYHVSDVADLQTLAHTRTYSLVFSDQTNWHLYRLDEHGRFAVEQ